MLRRSKTSLSLSVLLLLSGACASARLGPSIERDTTVPALQHAIWGIDVQDDSGRVLYQRNAHTLLMPASNRKLFAAASSIDCFGWDHQFDTELWLDGTNLVIRGGADPSLGGRWAFDRNAVFRTFIDALRARGITAVDDVIADVSAFDRETIPGSWKSGNLGADYAAPVDALAYNENVVGVAGANCAHPVIETDPPFVPVAVDVVCGTSDPLVRSDATNTLAVEGTMPEGFQELVAIGDPGLYAAQALRQALVDAGIAVRGTPRVNTVPRAWSERIAVIESPPLSMLLALTLKVSQNLWAEMLYKATAGTYAGAEALERGFLTREVGIDGSEFRFVDGCGLAPDDLVTPSAIVSLLRWMNQPSRRGAFWSILAVPGEEGTLHHRLVPLADRLRGKTGSINGVNALSGIVAGKHGGFRYFSIVINHHTASGSEAIRAIDAVANAIADF
ncbi:MAG TPA: D-alanyl-D-alanine carboxypeptidase/D-alanyl-D-alanine-endopeptidase [Thermoanaerobaculia bacterium]|nr:D-alanyl-D-alanine carboxypeptidase/D-alanyl-D-alanine-endopeptidase [Thermoanaerobaculia bacterium]